MDSGERCGYARELGTVLFALNSKPLDLSFSSFLNRNVQVLQAFCFRYSKFPGPIKWAASIRLGCRVMGLSVRTHAQYSRAAIMLNVQNLAFPRMRLLSTFAVWRSFQLLGIDSEIIGDPQTKQPKLWTIAGRTLDPETI